MPAKPWWKPVREFKFSKTAVLMWDIWARNRTLIGCLAGLAIVCPLLNLVITAPLVLTMFNWTGDGAALILIFTIFGYSEFNPHKSATGFPYRLFTLPVSSLHLVAVPMILGVTIIELYFGVTAYFTHG